jgi:hypothetical protein
MVTEKSPKIAKENYCDLCDYTCSKQCDFKKHLLTLKHQNRYKSLQNDDENSPKVATKKYECEECGKKYSYRQGLSYHKKKCTNKLINSVSCIDEDEEQMMKKMMMEMMKQNYDLQNMILELCKKDTYQINNTNNNTNSNNKTFNLQFFLNETCKDAMNLTDFVNSIQLQLSDVENVGKVGYVKGITDIIIKNLNQLDVTMRPVHCSDQKREVMYVKEEDQWLKEDPENKKLKMAIKQIANKNMKMIPAWKAKYPDCIYAESRKSDMYNHIMYQSLDMNDQNNNKIVKNIAKSVVIDKIQL